MTFVDELTEALGQGRVTTERDRRLRLSRDMYRYSQILQEQLDERIADVVVFAGGEEDVKATLRIANKHGVPVTVRGAGTGNYGQAVPLNGGVVLDMTGMDEVLEIGDGRLRAQAGARMGEMERQAREEGQELRIMPSTYLKSTIGGFVAGGSSGIGSPSYGNLWDGNVLGLRLVTGESEPRALDIEGAGMDGVLHAYGTTGVITEVTLPLAHRVEWVQVVAVFPELLDALRFGDELTRDDGVQKRLVSVSEAAIGTLLKAHRTLESPERHQALLWVAEGDKEAVSKLVTKHGGEIYRELPYGKHPMLSDLAWNHTTLWARKIDPVWTYLQCVFDPEKLEGQLSAMRERYGEEILLHVEYCLWGGAVSPVALPLLRFRSAEQIREIIAFFEGIGVFVADPHTYVLEDGGHEQQLWQEIYRAKAAYDPANLLNPGKLRTAH